LGVNEFTRHFMFLAPDQFYVWDELHTEQPRVFTTLLHSDSVVPTVDSRAVELSSGGTHLTLSVLAPTDAVVRTEPNMVTAPGPPGAVDKGEVQHRGDRIAISSKEPMKDASFFCSLKIENDTSTQAAASR
jgi:hypothetical protein